MENSKEREDNTHEFGSLSTCAYVSTPAYLLSSLIPLKIKVRGARIYVLVEKWFSIFYNVYVKRRTNKLRSESFLGHWRFVETRENIKVKWCLLPLDSVKVLLWQEKCSCFCSSNVAWMSFELENRAQLSRKYYSHLKQLPNSNERRLKWN